MKCEQTMTTDQAGNQRTKRKKRKKWVHLRTMHIVMRNRAICQPLVLWCPTSKSCKEQGLHSLWKAKQLNIMMWGAITELTPRMGCKNIFMSCCITQERKLSSFTQCLLCFNHLFSFICSNFNVTFHLSSNRTVNHQMSTEAFHKVFCEHLCH